MQPKVRSVDWSQDHEGLVPGTQRDKHRKCACLEMLIAVCAGATSGRAANRRVWVNRAQTNICLPAPAGRGGWCSACAVKASQQYPMSVRRGMEIKIHFTADSLRNVAPVFTREPSPSSLCVRLYVHMCVRAH